MNSAEYREKWSIENSRDIKQQKKKVFKALKIWIEKRETDEKENFIVDLKKRACLNRLRKEKN